MKVLKIGGSVLTRKDERETLDDAQFDTALADVARRPRDLVLVHGAGSFGHPHADDAGMSASGSAATPPEVYAVHEAVRRLNEKVVGDLIRRGAPAFPVHPSSCARRCGDELVLNSAPWAYVDAGALPVYHGDVVPDGSGWSVLSGDELAVELARSLDADLGMCTSAGGVLDAAGDVVDRVSAASQVEDRGADGADVTGGVSAKVDAVLGLETGGRVFGPGQLRGFLEGEAVGTLVRR